MYSHQRSKVMCMWKIIFVECCSVGGQRGVHRDPNAIAAQPAARFYSNTCQKMRGGKHVKVKKWRREDILRFRAHARKLILGSIWTPLDHLSVKAYGDVLPKWNGLLFHQKSLDMGPILPPKKILGGGYHFTKIGKKCKISRFWGRKPLRNGCQLAKISKKKLPYQPFFWVRKSLDMGRGFGPRAAHSVKK